jgi:hypothetical protein
LARWSLQPDICHQQTLIIIHCLAPLLQQPRLPKADCRIVQQEIVHTCDVRHAEPLASISILSAFGFCSYARWSALLHNFRHHLRTRRVTPAELSRRKLSSWRTRLEPLRTSGAVVTRATATKEVDIAADSLTRSPRRTVNRFHGREHRASCCVTLLLRHADGRAGCEAVSAVHSRGCDLTDGVTAPGIAE